jgi:hypothetical protein
LTELAIRSFSFGEPCGLWQVLHSSFPLVIGMCENRVSWETFCWWHFPHVCITVGCARLPRSDPACINVWQSVHATLRDSCALPCQSVRAVFW